jgi:hypothetical protein
MKTLTEAIQNYLSVIHKNVPLEILDCPEIQQAEIALEAALEKEIEQ